MACKILPTFSRALQVFLNICGSPMVPAPGDWKSGQIPQAVEEALDKASEGDEAAAQSLRFPLSCGEPRSARARAMRNGTRFS